MNKMKGEIQYRTYKTSVNILFYSLYANSKVYKIQHGKSTILPGIKYSLVTLLFGWWSFDFPWKTVQKFKNAIIALHINFNGGEDYTKVFYEADYDEKTVWVFNNLNREILLKTDIETIDLIIELQSEYEKIDFELKMEKNLMFINANLKKIDVINLKNSEVEEIISKIKQFDFRG